MVSCGHVISAMVSCDQCDGVMWSCDQCDGVMWSYLRCIYFLGVGKAGRSFDLYMYVVLKDVCITMTTPIKPHPFPHGPHTHQYTPRTAVPLLLHQRRGTLLLREVLPEEFCLKHDSKNEWDLMLARTCQCVCVCACVCVCVLCVCVCGVWLCVCGVCVVCVCVGDVCVIYVMCLVCCVCVVCVCVCG